MRLFPFLPILCFVLGQHLCGQESSADFTDLISEEDFHAAGLDKLKPKELERLNQIWQRLQSDPERSVAAAVEELPLNTESPAPSSVQQNESLEELMGKEQLARRPDERTPKEIESRLIGTFSGWKGSTIFRLENGQVWQQRIDGSVKYHKSEGPKVKIVRTLGGGYRLKVEGYRQSCPVKRIE